MKTNSKAPVPDLMGALKRSFGLPDTMSPREALDVVNPPHGDCNCRECQARAVLLRTIEQHEAAEAAVKELFDDAERTRDTRFQYATGMAKALWHVQFALTKGNE